jgi:hypothetical protein
MERSYYLLESGLLAYSPLSPHFDLALAYMMRWIPGFYIIGDADEIMALPLNGHDQIYNDFWEKELCRK